MSDAYTLYYTRQATGEQYVGGYKRITQKGEGIGSFFGNLFRRVLPLLKQGFKAVGKETLSTGVNVLKDTLNGRTLKDSVHDRITEAGNNLTKKAANKIQTMVGSGLKQSYKPAVKRKRLQSLKRRKRSRSSKPRQKKSKRSRKTKRSKRDIFD